MNITEDDRLVIRMWTTTIAKFLALAIIGALIGLWISPGRAYSAGTIPTQHRVVLGTDLPACHHKVGW